MNEDLPLISRLRFRGANLEAIKAKICGVYCFIHRESLKCYVGSSIDCFHRFRSHLKVARNGSGKTHFYDELSRLGAGEFDFEILETCGESIRLEREKFWISFLNSGYPNGYNLMTDPVRAGNYFWQPSLRKRVSDKLKGVPLSKETCSKISASSKRNVALGLNPGVLKSQFRNASHENNWRKSVVGNKVQLGVKQSIETIAKRVSKLTGQIRTAEQRKRISDSRKGIKFTEEHRRNLSMANSGKGHPSTPEANAKISAALSGRNLSDSHRRSLSESNKGKPWSEKRRAAYLARKEIRGS